MEHCDSKESLDDIKKYTKFVSLDDKQIEPEIKSDLEKSIQQSKKLQKDMNTVAREMLEKKNLNYDDKKKIEDLLKQ